MIRSARSVQRGYTLIELMVAMAIGMTLILGTLTIFQAFSRSARYQAAVAAQTDSGRYALERMTREILMAGYRDQAWQRPPLSAALVVENGDPDAVTVRYQGDFDCAGNPTIAPGFIVTNRFDVAGGNLRCNGEVIVDGVEDFQVLLGEDTDADGASNRILPPGSPGLDPTRVSTVRLHLLMATNETDIQRAAQTFTYFAAADGAGEDRTYNDGRRRLELSTVLALRNPVGL